MQPEAAHSFQEEYFPGLPANLGKKPGFNLSMRSCFYEKRGSFH